MFGKKLTIVGAAIVMLASSAIGATVLRSSDAFAVDSAEASDEAQEPVEGLQEIVLEVGDPPVDPVGETLVLVVAAQVDQSDAIHTLGELNARFGHLQGFSVDAADNYELLGGFVQVSPDTLAVSCLSVELDCPDGVSSVGELQPVQLELTPVTEFAFVPGKSLVLSGFRTKRGAEEFIELARTVGVSGLVTVRARKVGGGDIGLGQEPHPDGSGPLLGPLPDQERFQR